MKILLAADGSACTESAARHVVAHLDWFAGSPEVHVVHISTPIPARVATGVAAATSRPVLASYHREESEAALEVARKVLEAAGLPCTYAWTVGDVAAELDRYVREHGIDLVVMGSRGHGALAGMVLGSVTTKCLATLEAPILVVRRPSSVEQGREEAAA